MTAFNREGLDSNLDVVAFNREGLDSNLDGLDLNLGVAAFNLNWLDVDWGFRLPNWALRFSPGCAELVTNDRDSPPQLGQCLGGPKAKPKQSAKRPGGKTGLDYRGCDFSSMVVLDCSFAACWLDLFLDWTRHTVDE